MRRTVLIPVLVAAACGGPPSDITDGGLPDAMPPVATPNMAVVRFESYPAGGREITLRVEDADGAVPPDVSASIDLRWDDGTSAEFAAAPVALAPGFTAVLVLPSADANEQQELVASIQVFAQLRPPGERLTIFRWGTAVEQLGNFTADRDRFDRYAERLGALSADPAPMDTADALRTAADAVRAIGGIAPRVMRSVVVMGADSATRDALDDEVVTAMPIMWIPTDASLPDIARAEAAMRIDELAAGAHYAVTVCGPTGLEFATVSIAGIPGELTMPLAATLPEQTAGTCTLDTIGAGTRVYTPVIDFVFTAEQRAVFDDRVAARSKTDFDLSVRLAPGEGLVGASAHLRGKGSLGCDRKSYTVNLSGPLDRYLLPESAINEFHLISMCADNRYVEQYTANQIMAALGVFPLQFRFVEVRLDGVTSGVYLLLEKTMEELRGDNSGVRSVLRRRFDPPDDTIEVKWARNDDVQGANDAIMDYIAGLAALSGADLEAALELRFDVDQYLTFLAAQTIWRNGDYVDEAFYVSTDTLDESGVAVDFYETMGWDADDLFSGCHYNGDHAFVDPNQLAYCAEATIDHIMLNDALLYDRYVDRLEELLTTGLTVADFSAALATTRADILPWFERADICGAMVELLDSNPGAIDPEVAQADISSALDTLDTSFEARHALLLQRIATYRGN